MKDMLNRKHRIFLVAIVCVFLICIIGGVIYIRNLSVDWDAGACGGGYATFIFDKYSEALTQKFVDGSDNRESISNIKAIRGTQEAEWEDKTIYLEFDVQYDLPSQGTITERIHFIGQRTWFDTYKWSGAIVEG